MSRRICLSHVIDALLMKIQPPAAGSGTWTLTRLSLWNEGVLLGECLLHQLVKPKEVAHEGREEIRGK